MNFERLEDPEPLSYVCPFIRLSVTHVKIELKKVGSGRTNVLRIMFSINVLYFSPFHAEKKNSFMGLR